MINFGSLLLYLSFFIFTILLINLNIKNKKANILVTTFALSIPIIFATFRYGVGTDFFNYINSMNQIGNLSIKEYINSNFLFEIGHYTIRKISSILNNYNLMFGLYASITLISIYTALMNHKNKVSLTLALFLYLCIYYPLSLNLMPQFAAISLVMISFKYVFSREFFKFSLLVFSASLFHTTALVAFLVYFLWNKKTDSLTNSWKVALSLFFCIFITLNYQTLITSMSQLDIFSNYETYASENNQGRNRDFILKILIVSIFVFFRKSLIKHDNRNKFYILLMVFSLIIGLTGFTSPWVKRIALYFEVVQIFLIPSLIYVFVHQRDRILIYLLVFMYGITYFTLVYYILGQANIIPYKFYW